MKATQKAFEVQKKSDPLSNNAINSVALTDNGTQNTRMRKKREQKHQQQQKGGIEKTNP